MKVIRGLLAVAVAAIVLAGCQAKHTASPTVPTPTVSASAPAYTGIAAEPVDHILAGAIGTLVSSSVHLTGVMSGEGHTITFEVWRRDAVAARGVVVIDGHSFEVIRSEGNEYVKADAWFWTTLGPEQTHGAAATRLANRWVRDNLYSARLAGATRFLDITEVMWESMVNNPDVTKGEQSVVNGVPTIALIDRQGATVYIATDGVPYVIRLEQKAGAVYIDFSDHKAPVQIDDPPANQIIDLKTAT